MRRRGCQFHQLLIDFSRLLIGGSSFFGLLICPAEMRNGSGELCRSRITNNINLNLAILLAALALSTTLLAALAGLIRLVLLSTLMATTLLTTALLTTLFLLVHAFV
jgi:hypothetical protein